MPEVASWAFFAFSAFNGIGLSGMVHISLPTPYFVFPLLFCLPLPLQLSIFLSLSLSLSIWFSCSMGLNYE